MRADDTRDEVGVVGVVGWGMGPGACEVSEMWTGVCGCGMGEGGGGTSGRSGKR